MGYLNVTTIIAYHHASKIVATHSFHYVVAVYKMLIMNIILV